LVPKDNLTKYNVGVVRWDDINPHILYASSEPQLENIFDGVHKSFDITKGKARLTYNLNEAGDAMAIHQGNFDHRFPSAQSLYHICSPRVGYQAKIRESFAFVRSLQPRLRARSRIGEICEKCSRPGGFLHEF
jgi:hypothetical protein